MAFVAQIADKGIKHSLSGVSLSFIDLDIKEEYRSDRCNLVKDFYVPCLENATLYSRAVGFFSSTSMLAVSKGLTALIRSGGKMRLVASPYLMPEDIEAIAIGLKQREEIVTRVILQELDKEFSDVARDRIACLAWLLERGVLDIKLAVPKNANRQSIYHEKLGIFSDAEENIIAFTGSANESSTALIDNFECIDVFRSWKPEEQKRALRKVENFQRLWENKTPKVEVMGFPEAAARSLLKYSPDRPPTIEPDLTPKQKSWLVAERGGSYNIDKQKPQKYLKVHLRPLQEEALKAFKNSDRRGILAMATGAGKTITALACGANIDHIEVIFICAPTKDLVSQWLKELEARTTFPPAIVATGEAKVWLEKLFRKIRLINRKKFPRQPPVIVIGTYSGLSKPRLGDLIKDAGGLPEYSLLIGDEVHTAGANVYRNILRDDFKYRLGLSATPIRSHDEEGTEYVLDYFDGIIYEFSLEDAIAAGILCEYQYQVYITSLTDEEHEKYQQMSVKIARLLNSEDRSDREKANSLAIRRAKIIKSAESKIDLLDRILQDYPPQKSMIYCANIEEANDISSRLARNGVKVARYSSEDKERQKILNQFANGYLDALVAVKCLDEGVDVPAASQAIILASDNSERQFIQRRGRILRAAPKKAIATLIDILVVPPMTEERVKLIGSEVKRVKLFADTASNRASVITKLVEKLAHYGITHSDFI